MDVRLSDEQRLLSDTAARLGAQHAITGIRDLPRTPETDAAAWRALAEAGLLALAGEGRGEGAGETVATALVAGQLARTTCVAPYLGQGVLAPALLAAAGAEVQLEAVAQGSSRWCVVLRSDLQGFSGSGIGTFAFDACGATHALSLGGDGVVRLHPVEPAKVAVTLDRTRVFVTATTLRSAEPIGHPLEPGDRVRLDALAMLALAADELGLMESGLQRAVAYAGERRQFGRVIGSNQALAHLLADAAVLVEGARSCVWHAAWALDTLAPEAALAAARQAKAFCGSAGREVLETAVQVHGGIAITWEHPLHLLLRRLLVDDQVFGSARRQRSAIAEQRGGNGRLT